MSNVEQIAAIRKQATRTGSKFEAEIETTFSAYEQAGIATLIMLPVPTVPYGKPPRSGGQPLYIRSGTAPFDVCGIDHREGRFIGAELKASGLPQDRLPIVLPDRVGRPRKGAGLKYHQLHGLARVASHGGIARLVWSNGGQVLVIRDAERIINIAEGAEGAWKVRCRNGTPAPGLCSISPDAFEEVKYGLISDQAPAVLAWL